MVRVRRSSLQTTVHILCVVVRLPGNVSCWMKAALSISFCLTTPHLSSQLASPLLHTNRWTQSWLQTRAVKQIINILCFVVWFTGAVVYGNFLYYLLYVWFSLISCEIQWTESLPVCSYCQVHVFKSFCILQERFYISFCHPPEEGNVQVMLRSSKLKEVVE